MKNDDRFQTRAIHIGNEPDKESGAVAPPIHLTSTFEQEAVGKDKGFDYSRGGNPTRRRLEENLATLEKGNHGLVFASGMAATTTIFQTLSSGDHVIIGRNVYGGTYRMTVEVLSNHGIDFEFVDTRSLEKIRSSIKENTKLMSKGFIKSSPVYSSDKIDCPEKRLFIAILSQAVHDAFAPHVPRLEKQAARNFLTSNGEDFKSICELAGRDSAYVKEKIKKRVLRDNG